MIETNNTLVICIVKQSVNTALNKARTALVEGAMATLDLKSIWAKFKEELLYG